MIVISMNTFQIEASVPAITVFLQGILSFLSPCVLPLLPLYVGYLSGGCTDRTADGTLRYNQKKVLLHTFCFVAGVSFTFFLLGMGMSALALAFRSRQMLLARLGGIVVILFGLHAIGAFDAFAARLSFLQKERRLPQAKQGIQVTGPLTALLTGFFFSFAWTPCVGPTLSSVLLMAGASASRAYGFLLIGIYTLGFCVPFLLTGVFTTSLLAFFKKHRNVVRYTAKIGGVLMILTGVLMVTGQLNRISAVMARYG